MTHDVGAYVKCPCCNGTGVDVGATRRSRVASRPADIRCGRCGGTIESWDKAADHVCRESNAR